ncbi:MAG: DUF523 and DUF1722 domain-containing protein [Planctomycetes bacterium]|nr:DUF523 and DUF1722 domain-containing protein [Planctomycetota bacterium]
MVWPLPSISERPLRLGVSMCLLGAPVRYNAQAKESRLLTRELTERVDWIAVCPEMGIGMGAPRPTIRIVASEQGDRLVETDSGADHTEAMMAWAQEKAEELANERLHGFVLTKGSPSCGMERVKIYKDGGPTHRSRDGFFTEALRARLPWLPLEEDGRLNDPHLKAHFFGRVRAVRRLRLLFEDGLWRRGDVVDFHTREKFFLLAHNVEMYRALGQLVASISDLEAEKFAEEYQDLYLRCIAQRPTRGTHQNVLDHMAGFFKHSLRSAEKEEVRESIRSYRSGEATLAAPTRLLRFLATAYREDYLLEQSYFDEALRT